LLPGKLKADPEVTDQRRDKHFGRLAIYVTVPVAWRLAITCMYICRLFTAMNVQLNAIGAICAHVQVEAHCSAAVEKAGLPSTGIAEPYMVSPGGSS
jgi:hypothetical protein